MMITLLGEGDHVAWAEEYGLTFPVLADPGWAESNKYEQDHGIPTFHLLGRDLTIRILDGHPSDADIQEALDEPVPTVEWNAPPSLDEPVPEGQEAEGTTDTVTEPVHTAGPFGGGAYSGAPMGGCAATLAAGPAPGIASLLMGLLSLGGVAIHRRRRT
jgi:MYXO-CTERM domain-containing protein